MDHDRTGLIAIIGASLHDRGHVEVDVDTDDEARIKLVRSCAREVFREKGWRGRTMAAAIDQHTTRVHVFVTEAEPLCQQLWQAESDNRFVAPSASGESSPRLARRRA